MHYINASFMAGDAVTRSIFIKKGVFTAVRDKCTFHHYSLIWTHIMLIIYHTLPLSNRLGI